MWDMKLEGARDLERKLNKMEKKEGKAVVRKGVRDATKEESLAQAKSNASTMVGGTMGQMLAKSLTLRHESKKRRVRGAWGVDIKFSKAYNKRFVHIAKRDGRRTYIPYAIEYGHGVHPDQAGIPFLRSAWDSSKYATAKSIPKKIWDGIKAIARSK